MVEQVRQEGEQMGVPVKKLVRKGVPANEISRGVQGLRSHRHGNVGTHRAGPFPHGKRGREGRQVRYLSGLGDKDSQGLTAVNEGGVQSNWLSSSSTPRRQDFQSLAAAHLPDHAQHAHHIAILIV